MSAPAEVGTRIIGVAQLEKMLGRHRATIWLWCREGKFPAPFYLGARRAWRLADVEAWITEQAARSQIPDSDAR